MFCLIIFISCNTVNKHSNDKNKKNIDSLFLSSFFNEWSADYELLCKFYYEFPLVTRVLDNNLIINIDYILNNPEVKFGSWTFYINEYNNLQKINYLFYLDYYYDDFIPDYDSNYYDLELMKKPFITDKTDMFSSKLKNLHTLRKNDTFFQNNFDANLNNNVLRLCRIINSMDYFKGLNFKDYKKIEVLNNLVLLTCIQPLTLDESNIGRNGDYLYEAFRLDNVVKIENYKELEYLKGYLNDTQFPEKNKIYNIWSKANKEYLKTKIDLVEEDFNNEGVYYFYTMFDFKLIKITLDLENEISINLELLNKEYLWLNTENAIFN